MLREFYPEIEPWRTDRLEVGDGHNLYLEESGNPAGKPVVYLHGGPGSGTAPFMRRFFDPEKYRIILFDQRGAGLSTPSASLEHNTTWDLVADIEKIRKHLGIERWQVFGGSWGSTLALAYAQSHPDQVTELILRGIFLTRTWEIEWLYQAGAHRLFTDYWQDYLKPIPPAEHNDLLWAYRKRLTSDDPAIQLEAAKAWYLWEHNVGRLLHHPPEGSDEAMLALSRIENHYFVHRSWFDSDSHLLDRIDRIRHIPAVIVQGRYDIVCPFQSAWDLHLAWPEAEFIISHDAGHAAIEPSTKSALIEATDKFSNS